MNTQTSTHAFTHKCTHTQNYTHILYLSVLKQGSYTRRSSNICRVVQQNEENKCLGPFKCRVSKLFNLINVKMVLYIKENKLIIDISLDMCILLSDIATVDRRSVFATCVVFQVMRLISERCPYTVINVLASNHAIKLVNNGTGTCILPWTCEHLEINAGV